MLDSVHLSEGFFAHVFGGMVGGGTLWLMHTFYRLWERRRHHAKFDRAIVEFATHLHTLVSVDQIPSMMERVVPLVSRATFGQEVPPLKESYAFPPGVVLNCRVCARRIEPTFEGRCPTCKLSCTFYHDGQRA